MSTKQVSHNNTSSMNILYRVSPFIGGAILLLGLIMLAVLIPDILAAISGPRSMTLSEAAAVAGEDRTYASIVDGNWDCNTFYTVTTTMPTGRYSRKSTSTVSYTRGILAAPDGQIAMLVMHENVQQCSQQQLPLTGYLYTLDSEGRQQLAETGGLAAYPSATMLEFCAYCGPANSMFGAIFGIFFGLVGVGLIVLGRVMGKPKPAATPTGRR